MKKFGMAILTCIAMAVASCDLEFGACTSEGPTSPTNPGCPIDNPVERNFVFADDIQKPDKLLTYENLIQVSPEPNTRLAVLGNDGLVPFRYSVKIRMKKNPDDPSFSGIVSAWTSGDGWIEHDEIGSAVLKPGEEVFLPGRSIRIKSSFKYVRIRVVSDRKSSETREGRKTVTSLAWIYTGYTWSEPGTSSMPFQ